MTATLLCMWAQCTDKVCKATKKCHDVTQLSYSLKDILPGTMRSTLVSQPMSRQRKLQDMLTPYNTYTGKGLLALPVILT